MSAPIPPAFPRPRVEAGLTIRAATAAEVMQWDALVARFENCRVFHKAAWLRWIESFSGARLLHLVFDKHGEIVGCLPGFLVKLGPLKVFASPREGWQTGSMGPVFDKEKVSTGEVCAALVPFLEQRHGVQHIEMISQDLDADCMNAAGFHGEPVFTYRIGLFPGDEERVLRGVHKRTRGYLRNLAKSGLIVQVESEESFVDEFYEQTREVFARRGNAVPFSRMRTLQLFRHLKDSGNLLALSVRGPDDGPCMATGIFTIEGPELYLWGWTHRAQHGRYHPTELMTWAAMSKAMERGCVSFDMGGGGDGKVKFGPAPDSTTVRWLRSRYPWLAGLRSAARKAYRWQQSLRGRISRRSAFRRVEAVEARAEQDADTVSKEP